MTTLPPVSTGSIPTLPEPVHTEPAPQPALLPAPYNPDGPKGRDALVLFGASHEMHPVGQQQQQGQALVGQGDKAAGAQKAASCKVPDAATRVWDISKVTPDEIDALKKSCNPVEQRLGHTIENVRAAYGDLLPNPCDPTSKGAKIVVTLNAGNGGEPVVTIMGKGFDPNQHARVHTHYHGDNATVGDRVGSKAGQNSRIRETIARDPQTVFVLPECKNPKPDADGPWHSNMGPVSWSNVKSQADTTDLALKAAGITKVGKETVSVHSRGGEVIENLMNNDKTGKGLRCHVLEMHDSLYGSPPYVAAWGRTDNGQKVQKVIYVQGTNVASGYGNDKEIAKTFPRGTYVRIDISRQAPLDDKNNPVIYDGKGASRDDHIHGKKGTEGVRQYHPNPHYQTTGRFLAIWPLPN